MWLALSVALIGQSEPAGRYSHCAVVYNGHMIVYGGRGFQHSEHAQKTLTTLGDVWSLDMEVMSWSLLLGEGKSGPPDVDPSDPGQRSSHACVMLRSSEDEGELLVFGGLSGRTVSDQRPASAEQKIRNDVWKLRLKGGGGGSVSATWEHVAVAGTAPRPRSDHSLVLVDDGVLLYGGCIGGDVFGDVWLLHETANPNNDLTQEYEWIPLDPPAAAPPPTVARLPPPAPPPSNASDSSARPVPDLLPGAPGSAGGPMAHAGSTGFGPTHPTPPARCAHTAAAIEGGMLLFGGRRPLPQASRDDSWQSLKDTWFLDYRAARRPPDHGRPGGRPPALLHASAWALLDGRHDNTLLLNRSDHAAVLVPGGARQPRELGPSGGASLLLFGGLYTDVAQDTIYIMKNLLEMALPSPLAAGDPSGDGATDRRFLHVTNQLPWAPQWPAWRFDHTMVLAPKVGAVQGGKRRTLRDAPVLYGGGGGMDIFNDVWVYDAEAQVWLPISPSAVGLDQRVTTSLLFGTAAFVTLVPLLVCTSVCVLRRRISRARGLGQPNPSAVEMGTAEARQGGLRAQASRRGLTQAQVDRLPRAAWQDTAKAQAKVRSTPTSSTASGQRTSSPASSSPASRRSGCSSSSGDAPGDAVELEDLEEGHATFMPQRATAGAGAAEPEGAEAEAMEAEAEAAAAAAEQAEHAVEAEQGRWQEGESVEGGGEVEAESSEDDSDCCPVCLNPYTAAEIVIELRCGHVFHEQCISRWLQQEPSCPQCRSLVAPSAADAARATPSAPSTPHARADPAALRIDIDSRAASPAASSASPAASSASPAASAPPAGRAGRARARYLA